MSALTSYYETQAATIIKNLEKRNISGYYCPTSEQAVSLILSMIPKDSTVTWGGSESLKESGLMEALENAPLQLMDRASVKPEDMKDFYRKTFSADYYLMSTNALTLDGQLVNIDGNGNRVAALAFGPEHVILLVGMNKVAADLDTAIKRIHTQAAPPNAMRLNLNTPCSKDGVCHHCFSPAKICQMLHVTEGSRHPGRIHVVLVGESLGF